MSRQQKRIDKRRLRLQKQDEKSARLRERPDMQAAIRQTVEVLGGKAARKGKDPGSIAQKIMKWSIAKADRKGNWGWGDARDWSDEHWGCIIEPNLCEFERLTWAEIWDQRTGGDRPGARHKKHHHMEVTNLCDEALERWFELGNGEGGFGDDAFRFRLGNKRRLWGFTILERFYLIWWDPNHNIYPTDPD